MKIYHLRLSFLLLLFLTGCGTQHYADIQKDFDSATRADNNATGNLPASARSYDKVSGALSDDFIAKLEPKERANAWQMRATSEWRSGKFIEATTSAANGLSAAPVKHLRDEIILRLLPALVIDSENVQNWKAKGQALNADDYEKVESGYLTAMRSVAAAENAFGEPTPQSTKSYLYYHKWRMLYNWQHIIDTLAGGMAEQDKTALAVRRHFGGRSLLTVAEQAQNAIPAGDPMRSLIEAESKL